MVPGPAIRNRTGTAPTRENTTVYEPIGGSQGISESHGDAARITSVSFTFGVEAASAVAPTASAAVSVMTTSQRIRRGYPRISELKRLGPAKAGPSHLELVGRDHGPKNVNTLAIRLFLSMVVP